MNKPAILCIDDEKIILDSLRTQIRTEFHGKYVTEFAESPDEAFEVLEDLNENQVDVLVVISDWLMPEMRGDEFLVKVHERFPKTIKIMLTGHVEETAIDNAKENANLYACLSKPWKKDELILTIKNGIKSFS